jgi:hypothetical protein
VLAPELSEGEISRAVEVKLFGPVQDHEPPLTGCGPMVIAAEVEVTVALVSAAQVPLTEIYPTIGVGAQVPLSTLTLILVLALKLPEVPVTLIVAEPTLTPWMVSV